MNIKKLVKENEIKANSIEKRFITAINDLQRIDKKEQAATLTAGETMPQFGRYYGFYKNNNEKKAVAICAECANELLNLAENLKKQAAADVEIKKTCYKLTKKAENYNIVNVEKIITEQPFYTSIINFWV